MFEDKNIILDFLTEGIDSKTKNLVFFIIRTLNTNVNSNSQKKCYIN